MATKKASKRPSSKVSTRKAASTVQRDLSAAATAGKVDLEKLRERNPPLAEVLDVFILGKTARDDQEPLRKDLVRVLEARDPATRLGKALAKLDQHLAAPAAKPARKASAKSSKATKSSKSARRK